MQRTATVYIPRMSERRKLVYDESIYLCVDAYLYKFRTISVGATGLGRR